MGTDSCMIDEYDGIGDGERGKQICVIGTPIGGSDEAAGCAGAGTEGAADVVKTSEMTGPLAGRAGIPPNPGSP
jgi:hypothetical protein